MSKNYKYLVIIIIIGFIISAIIAIENVTIVPDLTGKNLDEAKKILNDKGLNYTYSYCITDNTSRLNKVINSTPNFTIVPKSSQVSFVVGTSNQEFKIIDPIEGTNQSGDYLKVMGTVDQLKPDEKIYVLVQPLPRPDQNRTYEWYVQYPVTITNNTWECKCQIGIYGDGDRNFNITAIKTTENLDVGLFGYKFPEFRSKSNNLIVYKMS